MSAKLHGLGPRCPWRPLRHGLGVHRTERLLPSLPAGASAPAAADHHSSGIPLLLLLLRQRRRLRLRPGTAVRGWWSWSWAAASFLVATGRAPACRCEPACQAGSPGQLALSRDHESPSFAAGEAAATAAARRRIRTAAAGRMIVSGPAVATALGAPPLGVTGAEGSSSPGGGEPGLPHPADTPLPVRQWRRVHGQGGRPGGVAQRLAQGVGGPPPARSCVCG